MFETITTTWRQPELLRVVGLSLLSVLLWRVPLIGWLFYPFRLLTTFVHELCHGAAAVLTGGRVERITVQPSREGLAHIRGGNRVIVISAGYVGAALVGGLLILLYDSALSSNQLLIGMGVALGLVCLLLVRNLFGFVAGLLLALGLAAAGWRLDPAYARLALMLLAVQLPLAALDSLLDLMRISWNPGRARQRSDAHLLAQVTGIPALIWALLWTLLALAILIGTITLAFQPDVA